jgi:hypothetical protein
VKPESRVITEWDGKKFTGALLDDIIPITIQRKKITNELECDKKVLQFVKIITINNHTKGYCIPF